MEKQLGKLEDVIDIKRLEPGQSVCRELVLIKVQADRHSSFSLLLFSLPSYVPRTSPVVPVRTSCEITYPSNNRINASIFS